MKRESTQIATRAEVEAAMAAVYQPKTGERCTCRRGFERDNCPACEGTGMKIDFRAIRERNNRGEN